MQSKYGLMFLLLLAPCLAQAEIITGRIARVENGATLILTDANHRSHVIGLLGIDAPDLQQEFGRQSQTGLSFIAHGQTATANCRRFDHNRALCVVIVDGRDLGLEMVRAGFAWSYPRQTSLQSAQEANDYQQAEFNARIRRLGLWSSKNPVPPWVWRVQRRH